MPTLFQRVLRKPFHNRPFVERTFCQLKPGRMKLPALTLTALFPDFNDQPVVLDQLPLGSWSTPLADLVMLLKIALCVRPRRAMEIGSYRGYTARALAQHLPPESRLLTVDCYAEHGEAYRGSALAAKIDRRVGETGPAIFAEDAPGSYDLIFVDADHRYNGTRHDTEVVLPLVSPHGFMVWHDYANWGYFDGSNGVPEFLSEFSARHAIGHVFGTTLAIHSPAWDTEEGRASFQRALIANVDDAETDPWHTELLRG